MKPNEIKAELIRRRIALSDVANEAGSSLSEVSRCVSGEGLYTRIREVIAHRLRKPVNKIFNEHHPKPKRKAPEVEKAA